jgi:HPt (histidine-containing phosphotransfer) domain-containing protein
MTKPNDRSSQEAVDLPDLLVRLENDRDLLRELITIFKEEFPPLLQSLQQAVARGELKNVEATSHALKGMLSGLSVTRGAAQASQLEQMAREGKTSGLADGLALLEFEVAYLLPELDTYIAIATP